jgi:ATP-dependent exoDNAse (exonuclease V) beta subunit
MTQPLDQPTRDLVSKHGLRQTLFVEAGAGTGKTTQLVDRIANLVLTEGVPLRQIAAITFTEAAAAELQSRIRVKFEKRAADTTDDTERQRCRQALADADLAAISTLHGFANRLLGEFAVAAGLPPRVRVLDEVSSQLAHEERWERFVDRVYDDPANVVVLERATLVGVALEPRYPGHATFKDVAVELNQNWDRLTPILERTPPPLGPIDFGPFDRAVDAVVALERDCADRADLFCVHLVETVLPSMLAVQRLDDPERKLRVLAGLGDGWKTGRGGKNAAWGGDVKAAKAVVTAVNDAANEVVSATGDEVIVHLLKLVAQEVVDAAMQRRDEGGLEFHDLLVLARDMLRTNAEARDTLHGRYTHILLDEFQDTDPLQIELATLIAASIEGVTPETWREMLVEDGRLFFVGDPKQSIYRFRRADIELFLKARDRFGPDGTCARLTTNFRTVAPILDWVNALFEHVMPEELEGRQPKYEPLFAFRPADSGKDHRPLLIGGPHADPRIKAGPLREAEALDVATVIDDVRTRPAEWPVFDESSGTWRPATLSDVTILVPTRTSLPYLREALERADIPYRLATGTLVYDTQEVRDALAAVRAIDDPTDHISLVAALRSPLYACSDVDLFTFFDAGGRWNLRHDVPDTVPADHPVRLAFAHLRSLWEQRWWLTPSALLERLLRERHAFLLGFGDPRPAEVWRRLRFLVDQARAFEEASGGGLRAFVEWAELQGADSARVHEPLLPETDDDAVRILTIHGAKGLEFPITILSGMTTQPGGNRQGVSVIWDEGRPPEVRLRKGVATANHDPRADIELEMDAHEKMRLLYVAATRARDHLVVSCHHTVSRNGPTSTYGGRMWTFFEDKAHLYRRLPDSDPPDAPDAPDASGTHEPGTDVGAAASAGVPAPASVPIQDDRHAWITARESVLAPQRVPRVVSATGVARAAQDAAAAAHDATGDAVRDEAAIVDGTAIVDEDDDGADLVDEDDDGADLVDDATVPQRRQGRAGSAVGRATHATLQVLDLADPRDIDAQVRRQCDLEAIPDKVPTVAALVRSALRSSAVQLAATNPHHKELFVSAPVGARVIEGYIDLLVETPDGLVVVDYKTDSATSDAEIDARFATYELQGASYATALEAATGQRVAEVRFVFCKASGAIERSISDVPAAIEQVRTTLSRHPTL